MTSGELARSWLVDSLRDLHISLWVLLQFSSPFRGHLQQSPAGIAPGIQNLVEMCTTSQYVYICSHPASYRFRTNICRNPVSSSCRIRDENAVLPYTCCKCVAKTRTRNGRRAGEEIRQRTDVSIMVAKKTWYIPSRCFVDIGFQNLDPFGKGHEAESAYQADPRAALPIESKISTILDATTQTNVATSQSRQPSPCCCRSKRMGAYQATRLEGVEDRQWGRIVDSFCGSWI